MSARGDRELAPASGAATPADRGRSEGPARLRATQQLVRALVTAPSGVGPALAGRPGVPGWLDRWPDPARELEARIVSDERLSHAQRLDVYAQAYFARLHDVLLEDHPATAWLCGPAAFHDLVTAFLVVHPSRSPNLRDLGRPFAGFLAEHPVAGFARARWPVLPDVARLERAFGDVFDAADDPALGEADLARLAPTAWAELPLEPVAAFARLDFERPVAAWVSAHRRGAPAPDAAIPPDGAPALATDGAPAPPDAPARPEGGETVVVWRETGRAMFRSLAPRDARALSLVGARASFGDLCVFAADEVGEAEAAAVAAGWLAEWVRAGWLARPA